ncbi:MULTISPECIES: hypothetical protein [unclassified Microcoleus]|uniref:hypothetical protein n=1 Tax=unclassified Microcoleus TaxID=2642155 RepID=UPI002FD040B0
MSGRRKTEEGRGKTEEVKREEGKIFFFLLPTVNCQLPTANCQLPTVNCQLPTANCQLTYSLIADLRALV